MYRYIPVVAMSNPSNFRMKKPNSVRNNHRAAVKVQDNERNRPKKNARGTHSIKSLPWPSEKHRCLLLFHDENTVPSSTLRDILKPYGTVSRTRSVVLPRNMMSAVEMSTSAEAEDAWRELIKNKPDGVIKIIPDMQHMTIQSYSAYWDNERVERGLVNGELLSGLLRINPKMFQHAFINDGKNPDVLIDSVVARNRALPGDIVAVKVRFASEWISEIETEESLNSVPSSQIKQDAVETKKEIKTGDVVAILEKCHNRLCVGTFVEKRQDKVLFRPIDNCLPRLLIPAVQCPEEFLTRPGDFSNKLFLATIDFWNEESMLPEGILCKFIGNRGEIESETTRILLENAVDHSDFPPLVESSIPTAWEIPSNEYEARHDLRSECIFTIDPSTAKDLDDALHCKKVHDNLYEVGVHIADVSYFVEPKSELDRIASQRCTSIYLVQKVIPMLPSVLCEQLCSLHPGKDRLTYSVIWKITGEGDIVDEWCGRTVIKSCAKLSYDHAQSLINSLNEESTTELQIPDIGGGHSLEVVKKTVLHLNQIAQSLRRRRFENGALKLDQVKLAYTLDNDTGLPNSCFTYQYRASNELVEEFMLLANISVAHRLKKALPQHAFLRCHPEPKPDMLSKIASYCAKHGCNLDISSSKSLAASLREAAASKDTPENCYFGLQMLAIKPQELAIYFCSGCVDDEEKFRHYALNVPFYTHFTSPIRRYADIIVHRQLSIALADSRCADDHQSLENLEIQAKACNNQKSLAKRVQDLSVQLFFFALVKTVGSIDDKAIVMHVYDHSFDVLPVKFGQIYRVYLDNLPIVGSKYTEDSATLRLLWPCDGTDRYKLSEEEMKRSKDGKLKMPQYSAATSQTITVFSTVNVVLETSEKDFKIKTYLRRSGDSNC